jgi:ketosteroid isomerase-like protein
MFDEQSVVPALTVEVNIRGAHVPAGIQQLATALRHASTGQTVPRPTAHARTLRTISTWKEAMHMHHLRIGTFALVTATMLVSAVSAHAQGADPVNVLQQYYAARSRGDLAAAMSLVAADATYTTGPCAPVCVGASDIQDREVGPAIANDGHYTATHINASGDTVTLQIEVRNKITRQIGIDRFLNDISAEVRDGKIRTYKAVSVPTDPQTATYLAYAKSQASGQAAPAQPAAQLSANPAMLVVLAASMVALVGLTLTIVVRRRAHTRPAIWLPGLAEFRRHWPNH